MWTFASALSCNVCNCGQCSTPWISVLFVDKGCYNAFLNLGVFIAEIYFSYCRKNTQPPKSFNLDLSVHLCAVEEVDPISNKTWFEREFCQGISADVIYILNLSKDKTCALHYPKANTMPPQKIEQAVWSCVTTAT